MMSIVLSLICGVTIPYELGLEGHSDADVALHALMDAILGAAGMGDIGRLFPDSDDAYLGADSRKLLREVIGNPGRPPESRLIPVRVTGPDGVLLETGDFAGNSRESRKGRN